jgi:GNAT superfamily N-acetyltransferase
MDLVGAGGEPAGWCSVADRPAYTCIPRTKGIAPGDAEAAADTSVWSVVCFYIPRARRRAGLAGALLDAAVAYARTHGAAIEGYPLAYDAH